MLKLVLARPSQNKLIWFSNAVLVLVVNKATVNIPVYTNNNINQNYYKILRHDLSLTRPVYASLTGQCNRTVNTSCPNVWTEHLMSELLSNFLQS